MKKSYLIAVVLALAATLWLGSRVFQDYLWPAGGEASAVAESEPRTKAPVRVRVRRSVARSHADTLLLTGQTEPSRQATLGAQTPGLIVAVEAAEGSAVKAGDVIATIDMDDRAERLAEAKALLEQRRIEFSAAKKLSDRGFQSQTELAQAAAQFQAAQANLRRAELAIEHTVIRAPFDGILQMRMVEAGDYLGVGDPVARVVDLDPLLAVAQVSEREIGVIKHGSGGQVRLVTGEIVDGRVGYVSSVGDASTRTFRIELELPNTDGRLAAGLTSEINLPVQTVDAHSLSPAALTLDSQGRIGVMAVDASAIARFHPVTIVGDGEDGVWVAGLPGEVTIITVGQEFVLPGEPVVAVPADNGGEARESAPAAGGAS